MTSLSNDDTTATGSRSPQMTRVRSRGTTASLPPPRGAPNYTRSAPMHGALPHAEIGP